MTSEPRWLSKEEALKLLRDGERGLRAGAGFGAGRARGG